MQIIHNVTIEEDYDRATSKDLYKILNSVIEETRVEYNTNYRSNTFDKLRKVMGKGLEESTAHSISNFDVLITDIPDKAKDLKAGTVPKLLVRELSRLVREASEFKTKIIKESSGLDDDSEIKIFCGLVLKTISRFEIFNDSFLSRLATLAGIISTQPSTDIPGSKKQLEPVRKIKQNEPVVIKHITLIKSDFALSINHGDVYIPFTSKKSGKGLAKEKKQFKALVHFWEFRWEKNSNGKVLVEGDVVTRDNLKQSTEAPSDTATLNYIKRLQDVFDGYNVPIKIEGKNKRYKLVIIMG